MAGQLTTTAVNSVLEQVWRPEFAALANEERIVTRGFMTADGVKKVGNTLNLSTVAVVTPQSLAGTANATAADLTFSNNVEGNVTALPKRYYAGVEISRNVTTRLLRYNDYLDKLKSQLEKSLATQIDVDGATLFGTVSNQIGGAGQDITESLLTAGIAKLAKNAKEYFRPGKDRGFLTVFPLQLDNVMMIDKIVNAYIRGDKANPIPTGMVWDAYNLDINESGNVYTSGGVAFNPLHIKEGFVLGFNEEPNILPEQQWGLSTIVIATAEWASATYIDAYGLAIQTQTV